MMCQEIIQPADLTEARSYTLFCATSSELLYETGLKGILEAHAEQSPALRAALDALCRRDYPAAAAALQQGLQEWRPTTATHQREAGVLWLGAWMLARPQLSGSILLDRGWRIDL